MEFFSYITEEYMRILSMLGQHIYLFAISTAISIVVGMTIAIFSTSEGRERIGRVILTLTGSAQSVPSIAVVALVFIFVGIGAKPAIIALAVYSLVPIVFNATSGILSVPNKVIEAGRGMGLTNSQILWRIKIPLAMPVIMAGIRSAATINIGTATVAGAVFAALLAITVDGVLALVEMKLTPKGLTVDRT